MSISMNDIKELKDTIRIICEEMLDSKGISYYKNGKVVTVNTDNTVNVTIDEITYDNIRIRNGLTLQVNDIVDVLIRNGNFNDKKVIDKY